MKTGMIRCVPSFSLLFHFTIMVILFFCTVSSQLSPNQKSTMNTLYELLRDEIPSLSWNVSSDPCSWSGVTCSNNPNNSSSVTRLSLSNLGLTNSSHFLPQVCKIGSLEALDVSKNSLSSIPYEFLTICGHIQGLKLVNFSSNSLPGPLPSFSNGFIKLESLDLSYNSMNGNVGLQLDGLVSLKSLNLSFNKFTGSVPIKLGKSMALEQLELSSNLFQGPLPEQLADYKNLTILDLSINSLTGNLPSRIGQLPKLEVLVLSSNLLSGDVPAFISRITTLERFAANQNNFSGNIPSGISRFLKNLDLSYNSLGGLIPNNLLSEPNLQTVDLSHNRLGGSIPSSVSSSLIRLRLGNNHLNGSILAVNWGELQNLVYLELENNFLSGTVPSDLGSCRKLNLLSLDGNNFSGALPAELGNLKQLQVLNLQLNNFVGEIPREITKLSELLTLNISWNSLSSSIPTSISSLRKLQYLHLQGNNISGSIPRDIGDMNSLIELQLGKNHLSGYIPSMPAKLQYALNLSNNHFEGQIPGTLSQLNSLEILDLSNNRFSGQIPKFLVQMPSLTTLLLENNNLSGVIPSFQGHVMTDFKGNPFLIKPPPTGSDTNSVSSHRKISIAAIIAVVVAAVFVGGLVAVIAIYLSRRLLHRVNDFEMQSRDKEAPLPKAIESHLLTTNSIHKSSIDFTKAMESVANPLNLMLKTKYTSYYKVIMPSGRSYFVKKLNLSDRICQSSHKSFRQELEAIGRMNCSNIMTPLAYMLAVDSAYLFYEMTFKGTLFDVLHGSSGIPLDWASRCSIAVGVAQGLASLHGCASGPVLLFDLTSKTIMLKSLKEPQIGDIELCKVIDPSKSTSSLSAVAGSVGYIPPEYAYTMRVTMAGNVYSFGVILLELLTGKQAVSEGTELAKWVLSNSTQPQKWDWMLDFSLSRTSLAVKSQMLAVLKIALACINASSEARPKMKTVLRMLLNAR